MSEPKCRPPPTASRALCAVEHLEEVGEVDPSLEWTPCGYCHTVHSARKSCKIIDVFYSWVNLIRSLIISIRFVHLCAICLLATLPVCLLIIMGSCKVFLPHFSGAGVTDSQLPAGHVRSSFVFTRGDVNGTQTVRLREPNNPAVVYLPRPLQLDTLEWNPPAVSLSSPVFLNISTQVQDVIEAPVEVSVDVSRYVIVTWVSVPCIDGVGSCTYKDVCKLVPQGARPCSHLPSNFHLPCECPVEPGRYFVKNGEVQLPGTGFIPDWLTFGWFKVTVKVRDPVRNKQLACYQAKLLIN
ncbi:MD-2-related lipid-recognition domain [Trinorchestia longiramus]|nr:MD-2-related lipid-recognition domain [Trinorchestia longiramus]